MNFIVSSIEEYFIDGIQHFKSDVKPQFKVVPYYNLAEMDFHAGYLYSDIKIRANWHSKQSEAEWINNEKSLKKALINACRENNLDILKYPDFFEETLIYVSAEQTGEYIYPWEMSIHPIIVKG